MQGKLRMLKQKFCQWKIFIDDDSTCESISNCKLISYCYPATKAYKSILKGVLIMGCALMDILVSKLQKMNKRENVSKLFRNSEIMQKWTGW